jgi:thiol-disulfide isomerase/thioredoxin
LDVPALKSRGEEDAYYHGVGVKYLGTDGALNEYINRHRLYRRKDQLEMSKQLSSLVFSTRTNQDTFSATFRPKYDSLYAVLHELDETFIKENPSEFAWLIKNERQSEYYGYLCVVHWGKKMDAKLFEKMIAHKPYVVSNDGMLLHSYLLTYLKSTIYEPNVAEASLRTVRLLDSLFAPPQADYFKIKLSSNDTKERKLITEAILPHINTAWCRSIVQEEYDKALAKSKRMDELVSKSGQSTNNVTPLGKPIAELSFGAKLYKIDKMGAEQFVSLLKNSFKNTAVLVDCWATWCSPCIAEFPHSKILHEDCQDLPLEFVYICTSEGTDLETWKRRIVDYELKGTHIFLERSTAFALLESLSFSGYPSYFILNTRGEYVSMNNQRPSRLSKQTLSQLIK